MRRIWLASAAIVALLWGGPAHAVDIVSDPLVEANTLQQLVRDAEAAAKRIEMINNQVTQIVHLRNTVAAVSHGNLAALSQLTPELAAAGLTDPLGADGADLLNAVGGLSSNLGQTAALTQNLLQSDQLFRSSGTDFRAVLMNQAALALATQKALAEQALTSSNGRLSALSSLRSGLDGTADVKAATDANARLTGELAVAQTQGNQLAALRLLQDAQTRTTSAQEEQLWRCQAESLVAQAKTAQAAALAGTVQLVSTGGVTTNCGVGSASGSVTNGNLTSESAGTPTSTSGSTALTTMLATSWGQQAATNAAALGVNPSALAATCVLESNCSASVGGTGTISGTFQMTNGTYAQTVAEVQASNPALASLISDKNDPASQSIAASQYLVDATSSLQSAGITNPTVLDTRSYYQFGPAYGSAVAQAQGNQLMSDVLSGTSAQTLAANGITSTTTVAQWRATVTDKIGDAASQPVLLGSSS